MFCQKCGSVKTQPIMFCQDSLNFCQTLVVTLTVCCSVKVCSHAWQNIFGVWQKSCPELGLFDRKAQKCLKIRKAYWSRTWINILKNPPDKSCEIWFCNFCHGDFSKYWLMSEINRLFWFSNIFGIFCQTNPALDRNSVKR